MAGRDTSWGVVTRAVGMYQARPLSVLDATGAVGMYQALPPSECELYLCVLTGAVGMYQARPLSVSVRLPLPRARMWRGSTGGAV